MEPLAAPTLASSPKRKAQPYDVWRAYPSCPVNLERHWACLDKQVELCYRVQHQATLIVAGPQRYIISQRAVPNLGLYGERIMVQLTLLKKVSMLTLLRNAPVSAAWV